MISKSAIKLIQSLRLKKFRQKYNLFVAEGDKAVMTMLSHGGLELEHLYAESSWAEQHSVDVSPLTVGTRAEIKSLSHLKTHSNVIGVFHIPEDQGLLPNAKRVIYLDDVQDPGNVGTIVRIADWFGVDMVVRSPQSASFYGTKTVMAAMGSIGHVAVTTVSQEDFAKSFDEYYKVGLTLEGPEYQETNYEKRCMVVGNEGHGLSDLISANLDAAYHIPGAKDRVAESLNAAIATAIATQNIMS